MNISAIISKVVAESLLSLYPVFVKKIGLNIPIQLWTRLLAYVLISFFFINKSFILKSLTSSNALLLAFINLTHIYFSYMGFKYLDSGVSFALFNTYPFMILLMSQAPWHNAYLLVLVGFIAFIYDNYIHQNMKIEESKDKEDKRLLFHTNFGFGVVMILLSAFTEAFIYFLVRRVKTENHWNHLFISYFLGAIIMSVYMIYIYGYKKEEVKENFSISDTIQNVTINNRIWLALGINGLLGALGYYLRFYANYRLDSQIYALLSYVGIIMAYVYGIMLNNESLSVYKVVGTLCIIMANYMILKK